MPERRGAIRAVSAYGLGPTPGGTTRSVGAAPDDALDPVGFAEGGGDVGASG
jgi:hypothetical protein